MTEREPNAEALRTAARQQGPEPDTAPLIDQLQRERADFLNYKRRMEREREEERNRARESVLVRLLPVLDDLDRAAAHVPRELEFHPWLQGLTLIRRRLDECLRELGVERFGRVGDVFDPALDEAVSFRTEPGATERRIADVLRSGFRMGGRVVRPAQVVVAGPAAEQPPTEKEPKKKRRRAGRSVA